MWLSSPSGIHPTPFFHSNPTNRKIRAQLAGEFLESLGARQAKNECIDSFFLTEGVSFIFDNFVSFRTDTINDLEVRDPFSFSFMVYSRKCIGDHIKKLLKIDALLNPDKVASLDLV